MQSTMVGIWITSLIPLFPWKKSFAATTSTRPTDLRLPRTQTLVGKQIPRLCPVVATLTCDSPTRKAEVPSVPWRRLLRCRHRSIQWRRASLASRQGPRWRISYEARPTGQLAPPAAQSDGSHTREDHGRIRGLQQQAGRAPRSMLPGACGLHGCRSRTTVLQKLRLCLVFRTLQPIPCAQYWQGSPQAEAVRRGGFFLLNGVVFLLAKRRTNLRSAGYLWTRELAEGGTRTDRCRLKKCW